MERFNVLFILFTTLRTICISGAMTWGQDDTIRPDVDASPYTLLLPDMTSPAAENGTLYQVDLYTHADGDIDSWVTNLTVFIIRPVPGLTMEVVTMSGQLELYGGQESRWLPTPLAFEVGDIIAFYGGSQGVPIAFDNRTSSTCSTNSTFMVPNPAYVTAVRGFTFSLDDGAALGCRNYSYLAHYVADNTTCLTADLGVLSMATVDVTSPHYYDGDAGYSNNLDVCWTFTTYEPHVLQIDVHHVNLEHGFDFLEIRRGSASGEVLARLTGSESARTYQTSSEDRDLYLRLTTDHSVGVYSGFSATVTYKQEPVGRLTSGEVAAIVVCTTMGLLGMALIIYLCVKVKKTKRRTGVSSPAVVTTGDSGSTPLSVLEAASLNQTMQDLNKTGVPPAALYSAWDATASDATPPNIAFPNAQSKPPNRLPPLSTGLPPVDVPLQESEGNPMNTNEKEARRDVTDGIQEEDSCDEPQPIDN